MKTMTRSFGPRLLASACALFTVTLRAQSPDITDAGVDAGGGFHVKHLADANSYFVLYGGRTLTDISQPVQARLGVGGTGELSDETRSGTQRYYRVARVPLSTPLDLDRDGMDDVFELRRAPSLNALDSADARADADSDGRLNLAEFLAGSDPLHADFFVTTSPFHHETGVAVTREIIFRFSVPLAKSTVLTTGQVWAEAGGRRLLSHVILSSDRRTATLFSENLPAGTLVRAFFDGDGLSDEANRPLDLDQDGLPGGLSAIEFTTAGTAAVAGTAVVGRVFASQALAGPGGRTVDQPLERVTVTVDGAEETLRAVTAADGSFKLEPVPAGDFFVHVDGRTSPASHWPGGAYYPFIGKLWHADAGRLDNPAGGTGVIYLPLIDEGTLQSANPDGDTQVSFSSSVLAAQPSLAGVSITVPANALFADDGNHGGKVGIAPVASDRLPGPLPAGLSFPLVITVQTDGPSNFDVPVPVRFPNLPDPVTGEKLAPGAKSALWSFNHDTGQWEIQGPMTVSEDGQFVVSDPGVGVRQPGWHGSNPGASGDGPPPWQPRPLPPGSGPPKRPFNIPSQPPFGSSPPSSPPPSPPPSSAPPPSGQPPGEEPSDIPDFPKDKIPQIPGFSEPESWGDLVESFADWAGSPSAGLIGSGFDVALEGLDMFEEIGEVLNEHGAGDDDGDGVPDVLQEQQEFLDSIKEAAEDQLPSAPDDTDDAIDTLYEWWQVWEELFGAAAKTSRGAASRSPKSIGAALPAAQPYLAELIAEREDFARINALRDSLSAYLQVWLGPDLWRTWTSNRAEFPRNLSVLQALSAAQQAGSDAGAEITQAELTSIQAISAPSLDAGTRSAAAARLNRTASNWKQGVLLTRQARSGESTDFVDAEQLQAALGALLNLVQEEEDAGFEPFVGRIRSLIQRAPVAMEGFFGAYASRSELEESADNLSYVLIEFRDPSGRVNSERTRTDTQGRLANLRLPADTIVVVHWLHSRTLQTAATCFISGAPGSRVAIPNTIWTDNADSTDTDQDGLPDPAERIVGTSAANPDTDGDGQKDGAEILAGTNPLDNFFPSPGIVASADTPGNAVDVAVETYDFSAFGGSPAQTRVLVADSGTGVAIFDSVNGQLTRLGQADTPGSAKAVALPPNMAGGPAAEAIGLAAVADGSSGLAIIDLSDPIRARVLHQVDLGSEANCVTIEGCAAYVGTQAGRVAAVDLFSGQTRDETDLNFPVHDVKVSQGTLFCAGPRQGAAALVAIPLAQNGILGTPSAPVNSAGQIGRRRLRLSVGEGIACVVHGRGYNTFDVSNPASPSLIVAGQTGQFGWKQIVLAGGGLAVAAVGANSTDDGAHDISVYDVSDPKKTDLFLRTIVTPGLASAVAVHGGLAYVADGEAGVQVIDPVGMDLDGKQPTTTLSLQPALTEVASAARLTALAVASDDFLLHGVEFYVDGVKMGEDASWPFEFAFYAPLYSTSKTSFLLQARAVDSSGNGSVLGSAAQLVIQLRPDTTAPILVSTTPAPGRVAAGPLYEVLASFNELMSSNSLTPDLFRVVSAGTDGVLGSGDDLAATGTTFGYFQCSDTVQMFFSPGLSNGLYRATIGPDVRDINGNALGAANTSDFRVVYVDLTAESAFAAEGAFEENVARDEFAFLARAGQKVFLDLIEGISLQRNWRLTDPQGGRVFDSKLIADSGVLSLNEPGRYVLTIENTAEDVPGRYRVQVWDVPPPQQFAVKIGDVISDGQPGPGAGNLESPGALDIYTFTAAPGQRIFLDLQEGLAVGPNWSLTDADGLVLFDRALIGDGGTVELTKGGVYTLTIGSSRSDHHGTYRLQLWNVPSAQTFAVAIGDVLSEGQPGAGAGHLESPGALDVYTFAAAAGQRVFLDVQAGIAVGPNWTLAGPDGSVLFRRGFIGDGGTVQLEKDGQYTLTVGSEQSDYAGTYRIQIWDVPPAQNFPVQIGDIIREAQPGAGAGNLETPGALDVYSFQAAPGQRIFLDLQAGIAVGPKWTLTSANGSVVFEGSFIGDGGTVSLEAGGSYSLAVGNSQSDYKGTYQFQIWNVPPPQSFAINLGDIIREGQPGPGAGNIESPGAFDVYTFTAMQGQRVMLDLQSAAAIGPRWTLRDSAGTIVFDGALLGDADNLLLEKGGEYALSVGTERSDYKGSYQFQIRSVPSN